MSRALLVVLAAAGCGHDAAGSPRAAPPPVVLVPGPRVPDAQPPEPYADLGRTLELAPEVACPRADAGLPGQPAPDPDLLAFLTSRAWCRPGDGAMHSIQLGADGVMTTTAETDRGEDGIARSEGRVCWALVGTSLFMKRGDHWWDEWPVRAQAPGTALEMLVLRERGWSPCPPRVPPDPAYRERP
jgi:hypothetical protein